mmetsp:Transcript_20023/g.33243  ORF Transcript_20023/g.33243 Transcript_20023/m.33243 type:complete len:200 (+) Transcript_20023:572-1171(+)
MFSEPARPIVNTELDAAINRRSNVIGVALDIGSNLQQGLTSPTWQPVTSKDKSSNDSSNNGSTATTQSTRIRDSRNNVVFEGWHGLAGRFIGCLETNDQKVGLVLGNLFRPVTFGSDFKRVGTCHGNFRPKIDSHTEAVISWSHICRGGWNSHRDRSTGRNVVFFDGNASCNATTHLCFVIVREDHRFRPLHYTLHGLH